MLVCPLYIIRAKFRYILAIITTILPKANLTQ